MSAGHLIDELANALLQSVSVAVVFREGMTYLLANARRSNSMRDRKTGRLRTGLLTIGGQA